MLNSNRTSSTPIPKAVCRQCSVSRQRRAEWCVAYGDTARPVQGLLDQCLFRTLFILFLACQSVAVGNYQSFTLHETSQSFSNRIVPAQVMVMAQLLFFFFALMNHHKWDSVFVQSMTAESPSDDCSMNQLHGHHSATNLAAQPPQLQCFHWKLF